MRWVERKRVDWQKEKAREKTVNRKKRERDLCGE